MKLHSSCVREEKVEEYLLCAVFLTSPSQISPKLRQYLNSMIYYLLKGWDLHLHQLEDSSEKILSVQCRVVLHYEINVYLRVLLVRKLLDLYVSGEPESL